MGRHPLRRDRGRHVRVQRYSDTVQMLDLFLNEDALLNDMCDCIEKNKAAGIYDGAYRVVELAMEKR